MQRANDVTRARRASGQPADAAAYAERAAGGRLQYSVTGKGRI